MRRLKWILIIVLLLAVIGGGAAAFFMRDKLITVAMQLLGREPQKPAAPPPPPDPNAPPELGTYYSLPAIFATVSISLCERGWVFSRSSRYARHRFPRLPSSPRDPEIQHDRPPPCTLWRRAQTVGACSGPEASSSSITAVANIVCASLATANSS